MGAPQGYTALGLVGYTDKGTYLASATYNRYNVVLYNGSSYVAIKDGITGVTPSNDGVNWRLFANGFPENGISTDNFQETLKQYISNSGTVNQEGFALDARQGNPNVAGSLAAQLTTLTSGRLTYIVSEAPISGTDYETELKWIIENQAPLYHVCALKLKSENSYGLIYSGGSEYWSCLYTPYFANNAAIFKAGVQAGQYYSHKWQGTSQ